MPGRHVALIRGINVGTAKRVAMADLRALVAGLGYQDPVTLLNSGNIVFTTAGGSGSDAAGRIEQAIGRQLGIQARVIVLSASELAAVIRENALREAATNPSRFMVVVFSRSANRAGLVPLTRQKWSPEALALGRRAAYLWCPNGVIRSPVFTAVARVLGEHATSRNWSTMTKLVKGI